MESIPTQKPALPCQSHCLMGPKCMGHTGGGMHQICKESEGKGSGPLWGWQPTMHAWVVPEKVYQKCPLQKKNKRVLKNE